MSYIVMSYPWVIDIWLETMQLNIYRTLLSNGTADDIDVSVAIIIVWVLFEHLEPLNILSLLINN